jgi:hypothetical protein
LFRRFTGKVVLEYRFSASDRRLQQHLFEHSQRHAECKRRRACRYTGTFQGGTESFILLHPRFEVLAKAWTILGDKLSETGAGHRAQHPGASGYAGADHRRHGTASHVAEIRDALLDRAHQGFGGLDLLDRGSRHWIGMLARWQAT